MIDDGLIRAKMEEITCLFGNTDEKTMRFLEPLIERCAFLEITLADLEKEISENGATEKYQNGANQWGIKVSASAQQYNNMIKNYLAVKSKLAEYMPEPEQEDDLMAWLRQGDEMRDRKKQEREERKNGKTNPFVNEE